VGGLYYCATISRFENGQLGEIFLTSNKAGSQADTAARDSAILVSLALQHGAELETIRQGLYRALNRAAFNLFQLVESGDLNEELVRSELFVAATANGLVAEDGAAQVRATIDSGSRAGHARPRAAKPYASSPLGRALDLIAEQETAELNPGVSS
jgi:hypothetical protein